MPLQHPPPFSTPPTQTHTHGGAVFEASVLHWCCAGSCAVLCCAGSTQPSGLAQEQHWAVMLMCDMYMQLRVLCSCPPYFTDMAAQPTVDSTAAGAQGPWLQPASAHHPLTVDGWMVCPASPPLPSCHRRSPTLTLLQHSCILSHT
jgi:hypothetical protein